MAKPTVLPIWDTDETNSIEPDASHKLDGWLAPGGVPEKPPFQSFNFWQNAVYKWLKEINQQGILQYDALTDYPIGALVIGSAETYIAAAANGPSSSVVNPVGDTTGVWENFYFNTSSNVVTGTANGLVLNAISGINPSALFDGQLFTFKAASNNTGAMTLQVGALAAKSFTNGAGGAILSGQIIQNNYSQAAYNKSSDRFELVTIGRDIPVGEKILFYKNTAVIGYLLLNTLDNKVVYVTKGSAAGGQTGGTVHSSGSWTITGLAANAHAITIAELPSHDFEVRASSSGTGGTANAFTRGVNLDGPLIDTTSKGSGSGHIHGVTHTPAWRPAAYNFTMQQRS